MPPLLVAQLTDTHLFATAEQEMMGVQTGRSLQHVLDCLQTVSPQPDLLLLTGDLSQDETVESYIQLRDRIAPLGIPTYWIPGNHDVLPMMQSVLQMAPISGDRCVQMGNWNFVLLSSLVPGCVWGELTADSLEWLEHQLGSFQNLPTLLAVHHPPATIGSEWMDSIGLQNPEAFYQVIDRFPQVKLVVFGHIHQEFEGRRNGVCYLGTPSTCVQFKPRSREMVVDDYHPGFRLLHLYPEGHYKTEIRRVRTITALTV